MDLICTLLTTPAADAAAKLEAATASREEAEAARAAADTARDEATAAAEAASAAAVAAKAAREKADQQVGVTSESFDNPRIDILPEHAFARVLSTIIGGRSSCGARGSNRSTQCSDRGTRVRRGCRCRCQGQGGGCRCCSGRCYCEARASRERPVCWCAD